MAITSGYYAVSVNVFPFQYGAAKEVGCYSSPDTAERVADFIRREFEQKVSGGIDIHVQAYEGEMVKTSMGMRLKETPNGAITLIHETLSQTEVDRILKFLPILLKSQLVQPKNSMPIMDKPQYEYTGIYHCVVLHFYPFDRSRKEFAGYYQSEQTALSVSRYIIKNHHTRKIGFGFDTKIETYEGKLIEYTSGKICVEFEEENYEILSSCDSDELIRISKLVNESIIKWS